MTQELWSRRVGALGQFRVLDPGAPMLERDDEHHLQNVLRARDGEEVVVTDGQGLWSLCEVQDRGLRRVTDVYRDPTPVETVVYLAPLKGDRSEWAVAKATELGVSRIVPLLSQHVVVKFKGETREKVLTRWRRISAEACAQCRRSHDVVVDEPVSVGDVPEHVAVTDFGGDANWSGVSAVAIGPEGGWAPEEWDPARRRLGLGPTVLRAETAAVVASTLLTFATGGWGFTLEGAPSVMMRGTDE